MRYDNKVFIKYKIDKNSVLFWASDVTDNPPAAKVLNEFLRDFSKDKNVYFHGYRLPEEDLFRMVDTQAILERSAIIDDPFNIFLRLSAAKVNIDHFDCACETMIYYFDSNVKWTDFLATSAITQPKKYIKNKTLSAYFASADQGADYCFECGRDHEESALTLLRNLSGTGCEIRQVSRLTFPYS